MSDSYAKLTISLRKDGSSSLHTEVDAGAAMSPSDVLMHARRVIADEMDALVNCPVHKTDEGHTVVAPTAEYAAFLAGWTARVDDLSQLPFEWAEKEFSHWQGHCARIEGPEEEDDIEALLQEYGWVSGDGELDLTKLPVFKPCIIHYEDGNFSQMLLEDRATITGSPVVVEPLYRMSGLDRALVGFQWHGKAPMSVRALASSPLAASVSAEAVKAAMQDAWNDICDDTGCHPLDIKQLGRGKISFNPNHWATAVAMHLAATSRNQCAATNHILADPCVQKLAADEPFFVLLGRDPEAYRALQSWIILRQEREGLSAKTDSASATLQAFRRYRATLANAPET